MSLDIHDIRYFLIDTFSNTKYILRPPYKFGKISFIGHLEIIYIDQCQERLGSAYIGWGHCGLKLTENLIYLNRDDYTFVLKE